VCSFLISPIRARCHAHLILLDCIILIISGEEVLHTAFCYFLPLR
jgi:hypothetical protein